MSAHSDHEAFVRAALHAAADSLEPRGDGLERIRARLQRPRPALVTRAQAIGNELLLRTPAWLQDVLCQVTGVLEGAWKRIAPPPAPGRHRSRAQGWLRPIAVMAVVMFVVAAVTYVAIGASTTFSPSSSNSHPSGVAPASHRSHHPRQAASHPGGTSSPADRYSSPVPTPSCTTSASASPAASHSVSAGPTPSSTTGGSSTSPGPSPSVTGTTSSPDPGASTSPSAKATTTPVSHQTSGTGKASGNSPGPCPSR